MENLKRLLVSRRVWTALVGLAVTAAGVAFPNLPKDLIAQAQVFVLALIASFTFEDMAAYGAFATNHNYTVEESDED